MNMLKTSSKNQQVMRFSGIMFSIVVLLMLATSCHAQQRSIRLMERNAPDMHEMVYRTGWALLIGINDYPNLPGNCQLNYATADALELGKLLQEMYGFAEENIITLTDEKATKQGIMDALASLADPNRIDEADCVLVFFSGHGQTVPLPTSGEMGFLVPHDARVELGDQLDPSQYYRDCIGMDELRRLARFIPARHVIFLVDACYSGLAVRSLKGLSPETKGYLKKIARLPVREIITAGRRGEESIESPEWGHGAFTYKLLEALSTEAADIDSDGVITGFELGAYMKQVIPRIADQTPQFGYLEGEGEFVFIPQRVVETATLVVEVNPGGIVSVDGGAESPAPLYLSEVEPGRHVIKVRAPDFRTHIVEVVLSPGEEKRVPVTLSRAEVILSINSKPEGARVMLDGKLRGHTPLQLDDVSTGEHKISLSLGDYEPVDYTVTVHAPAEPVLLTMEPSRGSIQIGSTPDGADIYINDRLQEQKTPTRLELPVGEYTLEVRKSQYHPAIRTIQVRRGVNPPIMLTPEVQTAILNIESMPKGASIRVNGELRAEVTPAELALPVGDYAIAVELKDYDLYAERVTLSDGQSLQVVAPLLLQTQLYVTSDPPGSKVNLGALGVHRTPALLTGIQAGDYEAKAKMKGYRSKAHPLSITPHERNHLDIQLFPRSRPRMALYSLVIPGSGQFYGGRYISGSAFLVTGLGAVAGAIAGYTQYSQKVDDYDNLVDSYRDAVTRYNSAVSSNEVESAKSAMVDAYRAMTDAHDDADSMFTLSRVAIGVAGGVWAVSAIHAYMTGPATAAPSPQVKMSGWDIMPQVKPEIAGVMVWRRF